MYDILKYAIFLRIILVRNKEKKYVKEMRCLAKLKRKAVLYRCCFHWFFRTVYTTAFFFIIVNKMCAGIIGCQLGLWI